MNKKAGLDALHYFVTVWKCEGNFSRAADKLGVTPSAVSQQISALKNKYGAELLARDAQGVRLTQIGKMLHASADEALIVIQNAERRIKSLQAANAASESLRIAFSPSHLGTVMNALSVVLEERKGLTVTTEEGDPATVASTLQRSDGPDLGIAYFPASARRGLEGDKVSSKPLALVTNRNRHPHLAALEKVRAENLKTEPLALLQKGPVRKIINGYFQGKAPERVVLESNMVASLLAAARVGFASTILPEFKEDATFAVRQLEPAIIPPTFLLWNVRPKRTAAALAFAEAVQRAAAT